MHIDIYHDTVCPWCRVGKQNMKVALSRWQGEPVTITYRPFFLNPDIPPEGYGFREYMNAKGGGSVPMEQWFGAPRQAGERVGLRFNFEQIERAPNSLLSHQLIALTPPDRQETMMDVLYAAYFEFGRDIGDVNVLCEIARENGLDHDAIRAELEAGAMRDEVLSDIARSEQLGISGVPFFVINDRFAFSGAQPPEAMLKILERAVTLEKESNKA